MKLTEPTVLNQSETEKIHAQSLEILERAGVRVGDSDCRTLLVKSGAKTDPGGEKVYLPTRLVEECMGVAPSCFRL